MSTSSVSRFLKDSRTLAPVSRLFFLAMRAPETFEAGLYKSMMMVKVSRSSSPYITASTPEIGAYILGRLEHGEKYEAIQHDCLSELHYLRPIPFQIVLLSSLETADEFLRNRATFDYDLKRNWSEIVQF